MLQGLVQFNRYKRSRYRWRLARQQLTNGERASDAAQGGQERAVDGAQAEQERAGADGQVDRSRSRS